MEIRKIEQLNVNFKKDMSNIELHGIEAMLAEWMEEEHGYRFTTSMSDFFGLAYTSSDGYAMYNATNEYILIYEGLYLPVSHFSITENNMLIIVCNDENENKNYFELSV